MTEITPGNAKFIEGLEHFRELDPETGQLGFMARELVQCTLPHRDPGEVPFWSRKNGNVVLGIEPGHNLKTGKNCGYPYGTMPRLLLMWMVREAVATKSRRLYMGRSMASFMRQLGVNPDNGSDERSDAYRLKKAIISLFRARITFEFYMQANGERGEGWMTLGMAKGAVLWWSEDNLEQESKSDNYVELTQDFYDVVCKSPVPLQAEAVKLLKGSSLDLDLYTWATYRVSYLKKPVFIPYDMLAAQFGADYGDAKEFGRNVRKAFRKVMLVYPALKIEFVKGAAKTKGGIRLYPSPTSVAKQIER